MRKFTLYLLLITTVATMGSCQRALENAQRNIGVEAVVKAERQGLSGAEIVLRVKNDTRHKLVLKKASLQVFYNGDLLSHVVLRKHVEVPRRATTDIPTLWKIDNPEPAGQYILEKRIREGDISQISVSYHIEGRGGPVPVEISQQMMPLSDFLNNFGLSVQDLINYMKE